jgi:hypothetical protein
MQGWLPSSDSSEDLLGELWSLAIEPGQQPTTTCTVVPWKHITMSTAVWPPIDDARLADEQAASQARELEWLLVQLRETLQSLKAGLEECATLLAPSENGSTLVLTSVRSESLKGLITRIGTRITKGVCPSLSVLMHQLTWRRMSSSVWQASHHPKAL